jgi:hypothetical protein
LIHALQHRSAEKRVVQIAPAEVLYLSPHFSQVAKNGSVSGQAVLSLPALKDLARP